MRTVELTEGADFTANGDDVELTAAGRRKLRGEVGSYAEAQQQASARDRAKAIMSAGEVKGQQTFAAHLIDATDLTVEQARAIIALTDDVRRPVTASANMLRLVGAQAGAASAAGPGSLEASANMRKLIGTGA